MRVRQLFAGTLVLLLVASGGEAQIGHMPIPQPSQAPPPSSPSPPQPLAPSGPQSGGKLPALKEVRPVPEPIRPQSPRTLPPLPLPTVVAPYVPGELLVFFPVPKARLGTVPQDLARDHGLTLKKDYDTVRGALILYETTSDVTQTISLLESDPRISALFGVVDANWHWNSLLASQDGEGSTLQYALRKLRAEAAHQLATGKGVTIAVIDTGIDDRHVALKGKVVEQIDVVGDGRPTPGLHGTALAGITVAEGKVRGIAPHARLLPIRAFQAHPQRPREGMSTSDTLVRALDIAVRRRAQVINLSFGGPRDKLLPLLVDHAIRAGITVVAAAGNGGPSGRPVYPAALENVIAVTATDHEDRLYPAATRGDYIAVAAPGVDVFTTAPEDRYEYVSGTSMAAAHVTGVVALLLEKQPGLSPREIKGLLEATAVDLGAPGRDPEFGAGRIDAFRAVEALTGRAASRQ